ncbi:MAG: M13 family metallopeptidase [Acidimicrobiia bacterium]|nr:MAG: M13 family metallopeptidase [Acidimicrobiia bacterium]
MIQISSDDPVFDAADSDPSVSPADDFYRFANGGWLDTNPVPPEYGAWGSAHEVHVRNEAILHDLLKNAAGVVAESGSVDQMVGDYYRSGMDTDTIEGLALSPIQPWLDRVDSISTIDDIRELVVEFHQIGIGVLFSVSVLPDFEEPMANLLYLDQGGLGLPDRDYYLRDDDQSKALVTAYRDHIGRMFSLAELGGDTGFVNSILTIETAIAEASYTNVQMRDVDLITNKQRIDAAKESMPQFDLAAYISGIGAGKESAVNIDNVALYPTLDALLETMSLTEWKAYFTWHLLRATASSLPDALEKEAFEFYGKTLGGQQQQKDRWKRVLAAGSGDIGQLISQLYVADNFTPESKRSMEELVDYLIVAMAERLRAISWMSEETREEALLKLEGFGYKIGYPDVWRDYTGLEIAPKDWMGNRIAASRFEFNRQIDKLGRPVDTHEWIMAPHIVNAYYHPLRNEIVFPAGMLQPPFFDPDADAAVNYGAIGSVIGHEITHGFDDQGSKFDATGQMRDWWAEADATEFEKRAKVVVEQFDAYEVEQGLNVNGELTLGENIADLGGLKIALAAMVAAQDGDEAPPVAGLTPEQRFYLAYARTWRQNYTDEYLRLLVNSDPHSPNHFRCNGPLSNLASFADAFDITESSPAMRPIIERADIW